MQPDQEHVEQLRKELNDLKQSVLIGNRDTVELKAKMQSFEATVQDSNKEFHIIKHDVASYKHNLQGLIEALQNMNASFKRNEQTLGTIRDELLSTQHEKRLSKVENWVASMSEVATIDRWKRSIVEIEVNTEFRTQLKSFWLVLYGFGVIIAIVLNIINFMKDK